MKRKSGIILFILIFLIVCFCYVERDRVYTTTINDMMDTITQIKLITKNDGEKYIGDISEIIKKYDKMFSYTDEESEIYKFNTGEKADLSEETYAIIKSSKEFYEDTYGAFDMTIGAVSKLWNKTFETGVLPNKNELNQALKTVNYSSLGLKEQEINLGAVAKGYIADRILDYINENKIENALVNLGGNIYAKGKNENNKKWNVGILDPKETDSVLLTLDISDKFVITSGNYIRYTDIDSIRYHHIIDAKTGYPANNELNSVTIISNGGFIGDALSTSCFLLGYEKSKALLEKYDVCAIFATKDNKIYYSKELESSMKKVTNDYEFIEF